MGPEPNVERGLAAPKPSESDLRARVGTQTDRLTERVSETTASVAVGKKLQTELLGPVRAAMIPLQYYPLF